MGLDRLKLESLYKRWLFFEGVVKFVKKELVSIITPVYNCEKLLPKTIECVLNQTYKNWEMLLVDDCTPDNSAKIISE